MRSYPGSIASIALESRGSARLALSSIEDREARDCETPARGGCVALTPTKGEVADSQRLLFSRSNYSRSTVTGASPDIPST
jgi:hypothetical protein